MALSGLPKNIGLGEGLGKMTKYNKIKTMSIDEVAEWIAKNGQFDGSPWMDWFNKKYCENCPAEKVYVEYWGNYQDCAWCELHDKCKFFPDLNDTPGLEMIIKMWLETEDEK